MSEIVSSEGAPESEKPVPDTINTFPPFPDPTDADFEDDISKEEREYYKDKFKDLNSVKMMILHCTACDRHLGCSSRNESRIKVHPLLRTLVCHTCHSFYNSGEFEKGDDGSELYCRWCGQGGQVYCCSACPHVFCAKCIKRNFGLSKNREIENTDDWKCFKCNSRVLWDLRAVCWAVLRYCYLKNKIAHETEDPRLKEFYLKECAVDYAECCKSKSKRLQKKDNPKKKEGKKDLEAKAAATIISKIPPTIQVKKFAAISVDELNKSDKKPQKRPASPNVKTYGVKNPITVSPCSTKVLNPISMPPIAKKMRFPGPSLMGAPVRVSQERKITNRTKSRPNILNHTFNGYNSPNLFNIINDNINLSLENLTQGLDMSAVTSMNNDDSVVCTPDFPLEPLCEVTEDNDDDVQCITPAPIAIPKINNPPPLVSRLAINDISSDNIIQMTENDVTVNAATGGLKFRVDPQTLSSNKMYRLPDGRVFAINANPSMPGGYSATIVALAETPGKPIAKGATFAAKLSAVTTSTPSVKPVRTVGGRIVNSKASTPTPKPSKAKQKSTESRDCDLNVPVEWYRYNLIDAVDALEYALSRLNKLKKEATTMYLRTRTVNEMRSLTRTLERLLNTSVHRFNEIRENINKELKQYITKKSSNNNISEDDDDDVEILPDLDNDDPIFIDENSVESNMNGNENQEVDLTGAASSEPNDSTENKTNNYTKNDADFEHSYMDTDENMNNGNESFMVHNIESENIIDDSVSNKINKDESLKNHEDDPLKKYENGSLKNDHHILKNNEDNIQKNNEDDTQKNNEDDTQKNNEDHTQKNNEEDTQKNNEEDTPKINEDDLLKNDEHDNSNSAETHLLKKSNNDSNDEENTTEFGTLKNEECISLGNDSKESAHSAIDEPDNFITKTLKSEPVSDINGGVAEGNECNENNDGDIDIYKKNIDDIADKPAYSDEQTHDADLSEEMIENLLKEDNTGDINENATNSNSLDIPELQDPLKEM